MFEKKIENFAPKIEHFDQEFLDLVWKLVWRLAARAGLSTKPEI